jgi:preprotein translocase subunit SecY
MPGLVFISYRRDDEPDIALMLYEGLADAFGRESLFMDVEGGIRVGSNFVDVLNEKVAECDVMLALVGRSWLQAADAQGRNRLHNADDYVRTEIEAAMRAGKSVIPVLVNGGAMPRHEDLPQSMREFALLQAFGLRLRTFQRDVQGLIGELQIILTEAESARQGETADERRAAEENRAIQHQQDLARSEQMSELMAKLATLEAQVNATPAQMRAVEEKSRWELIAKHKDIRDIRDHVARFPGGSSEPEARRLLEDLVWLELGPEPTLMALDSFIGEFPEGRHAQEAHARRLALMPVDPPPQPRPQPYARPAEQPAVSRGGLRKPPSATEQLSHNLNFGAFAKAEELKKRIWFTIAALIVFRIGTYVPLPGLDASLLNLRPSIGTGGLLAFLDLLSGGAIHRGSLFLLGIFPCGAALVIASNVPAQPEESAESHRKRINQSARHSTIFFAMIAGLAIAFALEHSYPGAPSGWTFRMTTMLTLTAATLFLMWLAEQITARGIGSGFAMMTAAGVISEQTSALLRFADAHSMTVAALVAIAGIAPCVAFIVLVDRSERRLLVQHPRRSVHRLYAGGHDNLPIKLNPAGALAPLTVTWVVLATLALGSFIHGLMPMSWVELLPTPGTGHLSYIAICASLIGLLSIVQTATIINPPETADLLRRNGGFLPGIRPGARTAEYIDYVGTRVAVVGSFCLGIAWSLPELLVYVTGVPLPFIGTSLFVVINVTVHAVAHIQSELVAHQYEALIQRAKLRPVGRH